MESSSEPAQLAARIKAQRAKQRDALLAKLRSEDADDLAGRLAKCGKPMHLHCTNCGPVHSAETRCDLKWCPSCQHRLAKRTAQRYAAITAAARFPLLLTLTVQNYDEPSFDFVRHVRRAFGKLRRLRWWRRAVVGGVASIEITNKGRGWHPHVHALIDCRWLSVTTLQPPPRATKARWTQAGKASATEVGQQWELCCQRKASVHVRRIWSGDLGDSKPAVMEVLKYSVKGSELAECKEEIAPLIRMMDGTRLVTSWGTMFGNPELKRKKHQGLPCPDCNESGTWMPEDVLDRITKRPRNYTR
jgi:hypothetical protein